MGSDRRRSPDRRVGSGGGGPMRNNRRDQGGPHGGPGPRMVPYQPRRIKGSPQKRCYVNNLPYDVNWQSFKDHMKKAGNVLFVELFEDEKGKSMGCGLVEYSTQEEAKKAIETLNDTKISGREIKVKTDETRFYPKVPDPMGPPPDFMRGPPGGPMGGPPMGPGGPMGSMGPGAPMHHPMDHPMGPPVSGGPVSNVIFVSNLQYDIQPKFIRETFMTAGEVLKVSLERDKEGKSKGYGTVTFAHPEMAMRCIDMFDQKSIKGRRISVKLDKLTSVNVGMPPMGMGHGGLMGPIGHHDNMASSSGHPHSHPGPHSPHPGPHSPHPVQHGPHPTPHGPPAQHGPPHGASDGGGYYNGGQPNDQQSKLLQSIGLAAISSMLGGGPNPMLSSLMGPGQDSRGSSGPGSSALENLLGRETLDGLLKTQSVGGSEPSSGYSNNPYPYNSASTPPSYGQNRPEHRDSSRREDDSRRSDPYSSERRYSSPDRSYKYRGPEPSKNQIFVRNIPFTLNVQQLRDFFRHAGAILDCEILKDKEGRSRGCATVRYESSANCERAVNMFHRSHIQSREIEVRIDN